MSGRLFTGRHQLFWGDGGQKSCSTSSGGSDKMRRLALTIGLTKLSGWDGDNDDRDDKDTLAQKEKREHKSLRRRMWS